MKSIYMILCVLFFNAVANGGCLGTHVFDPDSIEYQLNALAESDYFSAIEKKLEDDFETNVLIDGLISKLTFLNNPSLTPTAQNRYWRLLARLDIDQEIVRQDVADQMEMAYINGELSTRFEAVKSLLRMSEGIRDGFLLTASSMLPTEEDSLLLISAIDSISRSGGVQGQAAVYLDDIIENVANANSSLHEQLFHNLLGQNTSTPLLVNDRGRSLRTSAIVSMILGASDLENAAQFMASLGDGDDDAANAMFQGAGDNLLDQSDLVSRQSWLAEYTRRFILQSSESHREKYSISYFVFIDENYEDMRVDVCNSLQLVNDSLSQIEFRGYSMVQEILNAGCD